MKYVSFLLMAALALHSCTGSEQPAEAETPKEDSLTDPLALPGEKHFRNIRQLTFGGDNAEAYWNFSNTGLVLQVTNPKWNIPCDQIFLLDPFGQRDSSTLPMVSTGKGRTTCSYFMPGDSTVLYASTHLADEQCPEAPHRGPGGEYVWAVYSSYDIFVADLKGNIIKQLTDEPGYDAEATVSPKGDLIVFTSDRSGDLELYTMGIDGSNVKQVTNGLGYDGGAFFSPDGEYLIFRASRPQSPEDQAKYKDLLSQGLVQPTNMELYICRVDGSELRNITSLGGANWCPYMHPDGKRVLFASNHQSERGFPFNLYMINTDGTGLERITADSNFDAFPMFSSDGKYLVWSSNRNNGGTRETNIFMAEWQE